MLEADEPARAMLGLRPDEALEQVTARLSALRLTPDSSGPHGWFRRTAGLTAAGLPREGGGWWVLLEPGEGGSEVDPAVMLNIAAHELMTPLTALQAGLRRLASRAEALPADAGRLIGVCLRNADRLVARIGDVLDAAAIAGGTLKVTPVTLEPAEVLHAAVDRAERLVDREDVRLNEPGPLPSVVGDRARVLQVLLELLENAAKCSPRGSGIDLAARERDGAVVFSVTDRGPGVPQDLRESVFHPYVQVDSSAERAVGGLGLGLYVAKGIVEALEGRIWIEGEPGGSNTIFFTLPVATGSSHPRPPGASD